MSAIRPFTKIGLLRFLGEQKDSDRAITVAKIEITRTLKGKSRKRHTYTIEFLKKGFSILIEGSSEYKSAILSFLNDLEDQKI